MTGRFQNHRFIVASDMIDETLTLTRIVSVSFKGADILSDEVDVSDCKDSHRHA